MRHCRIISSGWLANAPAPIAQAATRITAIPANPDINTAEAFVVEALLQVFPPDPCPYCKAPVVSLLREAAHGSRRSQICGVCFTEAPAPRLGCGGCGESRVEMLPVFRADATEPARIDACDSCKTYVKTIDLTRDGAACPIADDLASVSLDLWATGARVSPRAPESAAPLAGRPSNDRVQRPVAGNRVHAGDDISRASISGREDPGWKGHRGLRAVWPTTVASAILSCRG